MTQPLKLSIVVPSFNHAEYIEVTLESLFTQRDVAPQELEVIVIDGGSSDYTVSILRKWDSRIAYWVSEPDRGQTDALIKGFGRCTGQILGWLCSDDLLEPWTVREALDYFRAHPHTEFLYGDAVWISRTGSYIRPKKEIPFNWFIWLNDHNYIPQPAAFWTRDLFQKAGGLDPAFELAMDGDLFARFAQHTRPVHVHKQWAQLRSYPEQKNKRLRAQSDQEDRIIRERMGMSFANPVTVGLRYCTAKAWRVGWKLALGAYR